MTDKEFKRLLSLAKQFEDSLVILPGQGENNVYGLKSISTNDNFLLDIDRRSKIEISKFKLQTRYAITNYH